MHVLLLDYTTGRRQVMATLSLEKGQIVAEGRVPSHLQEELQALSQHYQGEALLRRLPQEFTGTYLRAELVR